MRLVRVIGLIVLGLMLGYYYRGSAPVLMVQRMFEHPCSRPLLYTIGSVDSAFGISREELDSALSDAEGLWEKSIGRDLFAATTSTSSDTIIIRFLYDERQANTTREEELRTRVATERTELSLMQQERDTLLKQYDALRTSYDALRVAYEKKLAAYNQEVNEWNAKGGAPADVYAELTHTGAMLDDDMHAIVNAGNELKRIVTELNVYGAKINERVATYNELVSTYNSTFHEHGTFTQGTYGNRLIDIYQYGTPEDLRIVLAHELGHALGLGHVEGETSIMYEKTGKQSLAQGLSEQDIAHAKEVCGIQ